MERSRTCFECPYSYSYSDTDSYGCRFFGEECAGNKKFDDDVCYVHPKRLLFLAQRMNKHNKALEKECCKYRPEYRRPVTSKNYVKGLFHSGYEVIVNKDFLDTLSKFYRPNMKGGHTHNHVKNAHKRMRRCRICDNPITKYEGFKAPWYGHICLDCYFEECKEEACMCGIPFGWKKSDNFYRDFIRRAMKK